MPGDELQRRLDNAAARPERLGAFDSPFLHAAEGVRTVFVVTLLAACAPLLAGFVLFGWRAAIVAAISIGGCVGLERLYYRVTRVPALHGRSHAYLSGVLLALTLPPFVPWYIPLVAAAFAIIVGKAVFGGVGHFLWQPALVGRLAVAAIFPLAMAPQTWPVLAPHRLLIGDIHHQQLIESRKYKGWRHTPVRADADAIALTKRPSDILAGLTKADPPTFSGIALPRESMKRAPGSVLRALPPINDLIYGTYGGGIGETCSIVIILAGLYLIYRNYVKWQLPVSLLAAACFVLVVAPIRLASFDGQSETLWWPTATVRLDVAFTYVNYYLFSGELLLAAFLLAPEMTSRPVTTGGQVIFGLGCGAIAMLLRLYVELPIPCYMAVLAMNAVAPLIDGMWRPRVFGMPLFWRLRRKPR